ncbi:MAG: hypothetical protein NWE80_04140 [Candidatus Bathyarchaeota archaeon]|nr:hypothetical protein [Candidatus Bathyarchaeota archaeon]
MLKKLILSILAASVFLLSSFVPSVQAATAPGPWYNQSPVDWYKKVYDSPPAEIFGERYTAAQVDWIIWSVITWLPTKILKPELTACIMEALLEGAGDLTTCFEAARGGSRDLVIPDKFLASNNAPNNRSLLSAVFAERPFSAITYVKDIGRKFNLVPEAKAQVEGFGFTTALDPIQSYWAISRNIAYFFFILVIVVIAFMIMFRVKLSPQVVITVQSALPKIAVGLLLVTFSYAIAGLLVDLMYVVIGLISVLFTQAAGGTPTEVFDLLTRGTANPSGSPVGIFGIFFTYFLAFSLTAFIVVVSLLIEVAGTTAGALATLTDFLSGGFFVLALIIALVAFVILLIMLIWLLLRTLWTLARAYVNIILLTIFAPFQIAIGVLIPRIGFSAWVRSFISNLAVFVVVGLMFMLSMLFLIGAIENSLQTYLTSDLVQQMCDLILGGGSACEPIAGSVSDRWPPLLAIGASASTQLALLFLIVSFVLFTIIPRSADLIRSMITERPFAFGSGIGEGFAGVRGVGRVGRFAGLGSAQFASSAQEAGYDPDAATAAERRLNALWNAAGRVGLVRRGR